MILIYYDVLYFAVSINISAYSPIVVGKTINS